VVGEEQEKEEEELTWLWRSRDGRAALFAAHGGFLFLFSFPSPICARHEADRLDQREGEGEKKGEGEADREA
jgi:hypothetical protein